jgi:hypothetical protein
MPGVIIYRGPSRIDGNPIVAVAVWDSSNRKTGAMLQTYILREDIDPREANKYGEDYSICGDCSLKGTPTLDPDKKLAEERKCYVVLGQGPTIVFKTLKRGGYPDASHDRRSVGAGRMVRIGTYGDGAAAPDEVWHELLADAKGHTAYSHNGGDPTTYMVSADSLAQAAKAWRNNERTFRVVKDRHEIVKGQEIECPASKGVQCINCGLCAGTSVQAKSIAIVVHGSGAKYF